jgi:signal peptidase I
MEQRLFLIGVLMLAWALCAKYLKKKNLLNDKKFFVPLHVVFWGLAAALGLWLYSFVSAGGETLPAAKGRIIFNVIIVAGACCWAFLAARKADEKKIKKLFAGDYEWADTIYFAALLAAFVMFFFVQAFKIPSASMRDTLLEGDHLFVNKFTYGFRMPFTQKRFFEFNKVERGDIIIFRFPAADKKQINCGGPQYGRDYVKRVVAMPGDTVEIKNAEVFVNGAKTPPAEYEKYEEVRRYSAPEISDRESYQQAWEARELEHYLGGALRDNFGPVTVPQGQYFALGDNRDNSCDSRFWGPVPRENIKGRAWFIHWPISRIGFIK